MKKISVYLIATLLIGFMFLALPENGASSELNGCCLVDDQCAGCSGADCATSDGFCEAAGSTTQDGVCIDSPGGPACDFETDWENFEGCCVIDTNNCVDDAGWRNCLSDSEPILGGELWFPRDSCREVPQCVAREIPTMSNWGLIALAAVIGAAGIALMVIRRRKSAA